MNKLKMFIFRTICNYLVEEGIKRSARNNKQYPYHSEIHVRNVIDAVRLLARRAYDSGKITEIELYLLPAAAAMHDDVQGEKVQGENEWQSGKNLANRMRQCFIPTWIATLADKMIFGTTMDWSATPASQYAANMEYSVKLLADADIATLGGLECEFLQACRYLQLELGKDDKSFWEGQVKFMTGRDFLTEEAKALYPYIGNNLTYAKELAR
jgi:hypothetical protein